MKPKFKEDPGEWRKSVLWAALGLALVSSLLRWRHHLANEKWLLLLLALAAVSLCAVLQPRWFRGWYRLSLRLGFYSSQFVGRCVLLLFFVFIITPAGWLLRLAGKDPLQLKRPPNAQSCWLPSKEASPLDRLF
jgi:hypothetical protein